MLLCRYLDADDMRPYLREQVDALATDRVARAFLHLGHGDAGLRTLAAHDEWIALIGDEDNRTALSSMAKVDRRESPLFQRVRRIDKRIDGGLLQLLFESPLSEVAREYVAI